MKKLYAFLGSLGFVALCLGLTLPHTSFALSARKYTPAELQAKHNLSVQLALMKNIHTKAVAAYEATGPGAYFDAIPNLREFEKNFLRSQIRGLPSFGRVQLIEEGFVLADESHSIQVKIFDLEEGKLRINGQEFSISKTATAIDLFRLLGPLVEPSEEDASLRNLTPFPRAHAFMIIGALLGALAGLLFFLFKNNQNKKNQPQALPTGIPGSDHAPEQAATEAAVPMAQAPAKHPQAVALEAQVQVLLLS